MRWFAGIVIVLVAAVAGLFAWLWIAPPDLIRVGANYTAKIVCSNVFLADRDAQQVLEVDVQAPGHPLLRLMRVDVDRSSGQVRAGLFGHLGGGMAVYRAGVGCTTVPDGQLQALRDIDAPQALSPANEDAPWPAGNRIGASANAPIAALLDNDELVGEGMRAVVVVHDGRIVAERYGEGFAAETPLLGWSMTKTVTGAIAGLLAGEGALTLDGDVSVFPDWGSDARADIRLEHLLGMVSDLEWNESYGSVSDVTRMLFLEPDMAGFAASRNIDTATPQGTGDNFLYSSGTSVMIWKILQQADGSPENVLNDASRLLFEPLGMTSTTLEVDMAATPVGSSYMYATARDWARFGLLLLRDGVWNGSQLLPARHVAWMTETHPASDGAYGRGHVWKVPPNTSAPGENVALPEGSFFLSGHDGQSISVVPAHDLVVVRMGLTPSSREYKVANLVDAIIAALPAN